MTFHFSRPPIALAGIVVLIDLVDWPVGGWGFGLHPPKKPVPDLPLHFLLKSVTYRARFPTTPPSPSKFIGVNLEGDLHRHPRLDDQTVEQGLHFRLRGHLAGPLLRLGQGLPEFIQLRPVIEIGPIHAVELRHEPRAALYRRADVLSSALPLRTDIVTARRHVSKVP